MLFIWTVVLIVWLYFRRMKQRTDKRAMAERLILEYQLIALKAQINPHFMSNCLSSIQNLIVNMKLHEAADYISRFGLLVRKILDFSTRSLITLEQELEIASLYLELEQLRFKEKFEFRIVTEVIIDVSNCFVPALILNPILENAVWHGLSSLRPGEQGRVEIRVTAIADELHISVRDNGAGFINNKTNEGRARESKGILLIKQRLSSINSLYRISSARLMYEQMSEKAGEGKGTKAIIIIPDNLDSLNR